MSKLLIIIGKSLSGGGGAERRFLRLFNYYRKKNNKNDLLLLINESLLNSAIELGIVDADLANIIIVKDYKLFTNLFFSFQIIKILVTRNLTLVHFVLLQKSQMLLYLFLIIFRKRLKIKVGFTVASYLFAYNINLSRLDKITFGIIKLSADYLDCLYSKLNHKMRKRLKVFYTPCSFIDYEKYSQKTNKRNIILFVGRLIEDKNPILLIKSIDYLCSNYSNLLEDWKVIIYGKGMLEKTLLNYVDSKNLSSKIIFKSGDPTEDLNKSRIFVSLQRYENYPSQSLIEAIYSGNLIIATNVGDTNKLVYEKVNYLIKDNVMDLSNALSAAISDYDDKSVLIKKESIYVKKTHNINIFYEYINDLFAEMLTGKGITNEKNVYK